MSGPANRRGFLRGLVSLPLIGGGVTLIGAPTAVAEPITDALLDGYATFLAAEFTEAMIERRARRADMTLAFMQSRGAASFEEARIWRDNCLADYRENVSIRWAPSADRIERGRVAGAPSSRAALVLSSVGYNWREGGR